MKKIAVLLTILCVGQLYGMERDGMEREQGNYMGVSIEDLPLNIQSLIMYPNTNDADKNYTNLEKIIRTIIMTSKSKQLNDNPYDNQRGFTALVHMLGHKFNINPSTVAYMFKTPIAKEYRRLGDNLIASLNERKKNNIKSEDITNLINQGADVNYNAFKGFPTNWTPLDRAIISLDLEMVKLLLKNGADLKQINLNLMKQLLAFDNNADAIEIKKLIEKPIQKKRNY